MRVTIMILFLMATQFKCMNVVVKNLKTNTVQVAKIDYLYELGDTIMYQGSKHQIIRKKLKDGTVIRREVIKISGDKIPPPSMKR
jgi:hypothetical protein